MSKSILASGEAAPQFELHDINGSIVSLRHFRKSYVLIAFLRYSGCPWCNLAVHRLAMEQPLLRDNKCEVITFIQSSKEDIKNDIVERHEVTPSFPIIPDHDMVTYSQYGVAPSITAGVSHHIRHISAWVQAVRKDAFTQTSINGNFFLAPAVFLVAPETQTIVRADYNADLYDHESFTKIYDSISFHNLYG